MKKWDLIEVWIAAVVFCLAGLWRLFFDLSFPLPALRYLLKGDNFMMWCQVVAVAAMAVFMTTRKWHSYESLLIFRGVLMALSVQGFLYIGGPFALVCLSSMRAVRRASAALTPTVSAMNASQ